MSTMVTSSNGIVGHLHFFLHFHIVWKSMAQRAYLSLLSENEEAFYFMPDCNPPHNRSPNSIVLASVCPAQAGRLPAPSLSLQIFVELCKVRPCKVIPIFSAFYWVSRVFSTSQEISWPTSLKLSVHWNTWEMDSLALGWGLSRWRSKQALWCTQVSPNVSQRDCPGLYMSTF